MGDKLGASAFRNGVIDLLVTTYKESPRLPTLEHIDYVYQNTHPGARLRTLLVGFTAWYMTEPSNNLSSRPAEFVSACFNTFVEAVTEQGWTCPADVAENEAPFYGDICKAYHEHGDDEIASCAGRDEED